MKALEYVYADAATPARLRDGFIEAYKEVFAEAPYYETYSDSEVAGTVWLPHVLQGVAVLALDDDAVVGFGCAMPVLESPPDVQEFLQFKHGDGSFPVDLSNAWYMSELGVRRPYRGRGVGYDLIKLRLLRISVLGNTFYVMRTAAESSNSLHLYRNIGSVDLPGQQDVSTSEQVQINRSQSKKRTYLYGKCSHALVMLDRVLTSV